MAVDDGKHTVPRESRRVSPGVELTHINARERHTLSWKPSVKYVPSQGETAETHTEAPFGPGPEWSDHGCSCECSEDGSLRYNK